MKRLGIDIGSTTVKVAVIDEQHNILFSDYQRHFAKIQETLSSLLKKAKDQIGEMTFAPTVTGSGGLSISSYLDIPFCQEVVFTFDGEDEDAACEAVSKFMKENL